MTNRIGQELDSLYAAQSIIIRPGVSHVDTVSAHARLPNEPTTLLSVSRLETSKRIDTIIDALAELCQTSNGDRSRWVLEVAGSGPVRQELESYACQRGVIESVKFLGRVSDDELELAYQRATVFVMPALQGYGLPALEALTRNVPVVLHRESGVSEILHDSPWTEVIESSEQLASAIRKLCERKSNNQLTDQNKPTLPTDGQWAEQIASVCQWI